MDGNILEKGWVTYDGGHVLNDDGKIINEKQELIGMDGNPLPPGHKGYTVRDIVKIAQAIRVETAPETEKTESEE